MLDSLLCFLYHISPALVTVLLGTYMINKYLMSRSNEASFIDLLLKELDTIRSDSLEYWNNSCEDAQGAQKDALLSQKIKGGIKSASSDLHYYCERYCDEQKTTMNNLMVEVSDACTGGLFESSRKKIDPGRYFLITNAINHVRSNLFRRKL